MRDDYETNVRFIKIVEKNPCIYDHTRSDYSNRNKQDKVWGEIALQLNETVAACRERWKNIRGRYVKLVNKLPPSGSAAKTKKPYYLAEHLYFLDTFIRSRAPVGGAHLQPPEIDEVSSREDFEDQNNSNQDMSDYNEQTVHDNVIPDETLANNETLEFTDSSNLSTPEPNVGVSSQSNYYRRKNKQTATLTDVNRSAIQYFEERKKRQSSAPTVLDPDEAFLKSILPDMKNMTEAQKRSFKVAVLRVAGEILNQPIVTPPSILPPGSVTRLTTNSPASSLNQTLPVDTITSLIPVSCLERPEQEETQHWNESIILPQYSVISLATSVESPTADSNQNIEDLRQFCDY